MKKRILFFILFLASMLFISQLYWIIRAMPYKEKQNQLAENLGVDIENYRRIDFPSEYFSLALKPGMSIREVHHVMQGYEWVLRCDDYAEIYFYLTPYSTTSFKYEILYDGKIYDSLITDDIYDDTTVTTYGCVEGMLEE